MRDEGLAAALRVQDGEGRGREWCPVNPSAPFGHVVGRFGVSCRFCGREVPELLEQAQRSAQAAADAEFAAWVRERGFGW